MTKADEKTTQELLDEIRQLRTELRQMQDIVNSLVSIVMDMEGAEEDPDALPPGQMFIDIYN